MKSRRKQGSQRVELGADERLAEVLAPKFRGCGFPAAAELGPIHAGDHDQGRRDLMLGMFLEPAVPSLGECDVAAAILPASVDDQHEEIALGRRRHGRQTLRTLAAALRRRSKAGSRSIRSSVPPSNDRAASARGPAVPPGP